MLKIFFNFLSFSHFISISITQILFSIIFLFIIYKVWKKDLKFYSERVLYLFLIFFILYDISLIVNFNNFPNFNKFIKHIFGWWHYLFFVISLIFMKNFKPNFKNIFNFVLAGSAIASFYGFYQFFFLHKRAEGFYSHPLTFGNNLAIVLIVLYSLIITKYYINKREFWFYIIFFLVNFTALLISLSRGPILAFLITVMVINVLVYKYKGLIVNIIIVVLFTSIVLFTPALKQRANDFFNHSWKNTTSSFGTRVVLWKTSLKIIKDNPFFGIGYNIKSEFKKRIKVPVSSMAHSHNSYLTIACYYGVPALIILLLIYFYLMKSFWIKNDFFVKVSGIGTILVYMLEGLTEYNFGDSEVLMFFWLLIGILYSLNSNKNYTDAVNE